jgi:hypothetical protein
METSQPRHQGYCRRGVGRPLPGRCRWVTVPRFEALQEEIFEYEILTGQQVSVIIMRHTGQPPDLCRGAKADWG